MLDHLHACVCVCSSSGCAVGVSSDMAVAAEVQGAAGEVGYWMCTFLIRNGLPALKLVRNR